MNKPVLRLVIFDCDGVLIDSEPLSREVVREEACALGWPITLPELQAMTGLTWSALKPIFEARIGQVLPDDWPALLQDRLVHRLASGVAAMPGAPGLLETVSAQKLPYRIASNSSHAEMALKFRATGLLPWVEGRIHSAHDVARGKPAPDLFMAAAASEGVPPESCMVVEDSAPGIAAALAAGMRVIGYAPHGRQAEPGFLPECWVTSLDELPAIFASAAGQVPA